jgi:hypothetical protein
LQGLNKRDASVFDLYALDLTTLALTLHTVNPGDISSWLLDYDFNVRVRHALDQCRYREALLG